MMVSWNEYIKNGMVKKTMPNRGRIKTLINVADSGLNIYSKINFNEDNSFIVFKDYYDSLRSVCEAVCLLKGYKIYSHEAVGLFFKNILEEEAFFHKFDRFRKIRNGIVYYGETISFAETKQGIKDIQDMINKLKEKYLKEFI